MSKNDQADSLERVTPWQFSPQSGHTRNLRQRFAVSREKKNLSQRQVAERIAQRLGKESHSKASISAYEKMTRQPPIDVMAAWARAVGWRLHVDALPFDDPRKWYAVTPEAGRIAMEIDAADPETRKAVLTALNMMLGIASE